MSNESKRLWLMYPTRLISRPIVYELGKQFPLVTNIRQCSTSSEVGIVCLEIEGELEVIEKGIVWLEEQGVKVQPVEIQTIEG